MDGKQATADAPVEEIEARVRQAFTRLALEVGGLVALHALPDEAVFTLCRCVDGAFRSCLAPLADMRRPADARRHGESRARRHPAVQHLLAVIDTHESNQKEA